ncbi:MAG: hypothetical protein HUU20_02655 [Pirellulales bacterium]|nr:hypothetical protein [Pirellulales bacterium]
MMDAINSVLQARQAELDSRIQFAVAKKALDVMKTQGNAVVQLIEAAGRAGKAEGAGEHFDATG